MRDRYVMKHTLVNTGKQTVKTALVALYLASLAAQQDHDEVVEIRDWHIMMAPIWAEPVKSRLHIPTEEANESDRA